MIFFNTSSKPHDYHYSLSTPSIDENETKIKDGGPTKQETKTRIIYGNNLSSVLNKFPIICKYEMNVISDKEGASKIVNVSEITSFYRTLKNESIAIKMIIEIDSDNADYCKQLISQFGIELGHLSQIKCNFAISDNRGYLATTMLLENEPLFEVVYGDAKEIVEQNQFVFETLKNQCPLNKE